jgi:hypothetical protein
MFACFSAYHVQEYMDMCFHHFLYTLQAIDGIVPHQACMVVNIYGKVPCHASLSF